MSKRKNKKSTRAKNRDIEALKTDIKEHIKGLSTLFMSIFFVCGARWFYNTHYPTNEILSLLIDKVTMIAIILLSGLLLYKLFISVFVTCAELRRIKKEYKKN